MPDIVITTNRGANSNPKIDFTGTTAGTIKLEVLANGSLSWNGASGSLFSITDSLSGSLMSVNDISGLPAFEVFSDNRVVVGQFGASLLLGKTTNSSNGRLQLTSHTTSAGGIGFGTDISIFRSAANVLTAATTTFAVAGEVTATSNITAYYSDDRLKNNLGNIPNALAKVLSLNGFYFEANETAQKLGYEKKREIGVSAQQVQEILPEIIAPAPIDPQYMTVRYEKLIPLLIEAIKAQQVQIEELKAHVTIIEQNLNNK